MASEPSDLDLNLLRALDPLLRTRSVSAAARALGLGQPAMSKTLARLRAHFGDPLLVRVGHTMVPTARATALIEPVRTALEAAARALAPGETFVPERARGSVVLAMPEHAHATVVVPLVARLSREAPLLDVRVRTLTLASRAELARGDVHLAVMPDLSLLPHLPQPDLSQFVVRPLYADRYAVASARSSKRRRWTLPAYAAARHVLVSSLGESDVGIVDQALARAGLGRKVALAVPGFLEAARMVAGSDLVTTLPERMLRASGYPLDIVPPPCELPPLAMQIAWHPRDTRDPRHEWLREQVTASVLAVSRGRRAAPPRSPR